MLSVLFDWNLSRCLFLDRSWVQIYCSAQDSIDNMRIVFSQGLSQRPRAQLNVWYGEYKRQLRRQAHTVAAQKLSAAAMHLCLKLHPVLTRGARQIRPRPCHAPVRVLTLAPVTLSSVLRPVRVIASVRVTAWYAYRRSLCV